MLDPRLGHAWKEISLETYYESYQWFQRECRSFASVTMLKKILLCSRLNKEHERSESKFIPGFIQHFLSFFLVFLFLHSNGSTIAWKEDNKIVNVITLYSFSLLISKQPMDEWTNRILCKRLWHLLDTGFSLFPVHERALAPIETSSLLSSSTPLLHSCGNHFLVVHRFYVCKRTERQKETGFVQDFVNFWDAFKQERNTRRLQG